MCDAATDDAAADDEEDKRPGARQTGMSKKMAATESDGQGGASGGEYLEQLRHFDFMISEGNCALSPQTSGGRRCAGVRRQPVVEVGALRPGRARESGASAGVVVPAHE